MATTKAKPSKSKIIREIIEANPKASVEEVKAELVKRKVKASDSLIGTLVYMRPGRKKRGGKRRVKRQAAIASNGSANMDHLFAAKLLVGKTGGIEPAQAALAQLAKLLS